MIRTQIYLPEETHYNLSRLAKEKKSSLSELLREGAKMLMKKHYGKLTPQQEASRYFGNPNKKDRLKLTGAELVAELRRDRDS